MFKEFLAIYNKIVSNFAVSNERAILNKIKTGKATTSI